MSGKSGSTKNQTARLMFEPDVVQVKFHDACRVRIREDRLVDLNGKGLKSKRAAALLERVKGGTWMPTFSAGEKTLDKSRQVAAERPGPPPPDLANYYILVLPEGISSFEIAPEFMALGEVEYAMPVYKPAPPPTAPQLVRAATDITGGMISLTFDTEMSDPAGKHGQFRYQLDLGPDQSFTAAALNADRKMIDLTCSAPIAFGHSISVEYTAGSVTDVDGHPLATFAPRLVTIVNILPDYSRPSPLTTIPFQEYLFPSAGHNGVDANYAWTISGGTGAGVNICDIEIMWNRNHRDLQGNGGVQVIGLPPRDPTNYGPAHGTAVLGVYGGDHDGRGVRGIAYEAGKFVSGDSTRNFWNVADAINTAANSPEMRPGDIILLEEQIAGPSVVLDPRTWRDAIENDSHVGLVAVEWDRAVYDAITDAVRRGFIVVEAAGNGRENLDDRVFHPLPDVPRPKHWPDWLPWNKPAHEPFRRQNDSGAIMVGAGDSRTRERIHEADWGSNYGERLDVQGWGNDVLTTTASGDSDILWNRGGDDYLYTGDFGGTSSASAMIAGVCASLQGVFRSVYGRPASCQELRAILVETGTPQAGDRSRHIGPLPNLRNAIRRIAADAPDILPANGDFPVYPNHLSVWIGLPSSMWWNNNYRNIKIWATTDGSDPVEDALRARLIWSGDSADSHAYGTLHLSDPGTVVVKAAAFMDNRELGGRLKSATATREYSLYQPLSGPPNLRATQGTLASLVRVSWDPIAGAGSYEIWAGWGDPNAPASSSRFVHQIATVAGATFYDDVNANTDGSEMRYWVRAVLQNHRKTLFSGPVDGHIGIPAIVFEVSKGDAGTALITWERASFQDDWNSKEITYHVYRGGTAVWRQAIEVFQMAAVQLKWVESRGRRYPTWPESPREYRDSGVVPGQTYYYWVRASLKTSDGERVWTPPGSPKAWLCAP